MKKFYEVSSGLQSHCFCTDLSAGRRLLSEKLEVQASTFRPTEIVDLDRAASHQSSSNFYDGKGRPACAGATLHLLVPCENLHGLVLVHYAQLVVYAGRTGSHGSRSYL